MFKIIFVCVLIVCPDFSLCVNLCGDWDQYKDIKCLKVLEKKGTEEEALKNCTKLDQSSTLLTIHSKEEQDYLNNLLENYQNISLNVWLGLKYTDKAFRWMDGSNPNYTNWSDDAVKDGSTLCAQMSLKLILGKWMDESCTKSALIVCEKKQELNLDLNKIKTTLESLENEIKKLNNENQNQNKVIESQKSEFIQKFQTQENEIKNQKTDFTQKLINQENEIKALKSMAIPIGFIYTQLPTQSSPQLLWPNTKWTEITSQYSGLFFRAEGGESEPFGRTQQANQSWISNIGYYGCRYTTWSGERCTNGKFIPLTQGSWIDVGPGGLPNALEFPNTLRVYTTKGEIRPKNTAIKIFKRIQ